MKTTIIKQWIWYLFLILTFLPAPGFGQTWMDQGLYGGQIPILAIDPKDGSCLFAGSWEGDGLFKTSNGGETWGSIEGFRNEDLRSIAIAPADHLTVWAASASSLYKSRDGGLTWESYDPARKGKEWRYYFSLVIDPEDPDIVYAGCSGLYGTDSGGCIFRTENSGRSWKQLDVKADHIPWAIAINPLNTGEIWFVTNTFSSEDGSIYRSNDKGLNWTQIGTNLSPGWFEEIVINPEKPKTVYAGGENGVYRTRDGGKNWKQLLPDSWCESIVLDPHDPDIVYAGWNLNFSKSTDGGDTWITYDLSSEFFPLEFLTLVVSPSDRHVIYGGDSSLGVFKSEDGGATWIPINQGIRANAVSCSETQKDGSIYAGTIAGLYRRTSDGIWTCLNSRNTFSFKSDLYDSEILYAGFNWGLEKSTDGGLSWKEVLSPSLWDPNRVETIAINPLDSRIIYAGIFYYSGKKGEVYKSRNGGKSWVKVLGVRRPVNVIEIHPLNPSIIYAGSGYRKNPAFSGNLYKSDDGGETWFITGLKDKVVNAIAIDPYNPEVLYAGTAVPEGSASRGLYRSIDGGLTWEEKGNGMPRGATVTALRVDSSSPSIIYAATLDKGIYLTLNGGEYWTFLGLSDHFSYDLLLPFLSEKEVSPPVQSFFTPFSLYAGTGSGFLRFTTSGVGMIEGMVTDCANQQGITSVEVMTDTGGMALSLDGYYLIMAPAGICTVSAATDCYQSAQAGHVVVNEFDVASVDLCILPQDGITGKVTSKGKAVKGAAVTISKEGVKLSETYTDENGRYAFVDLQAGNYAISVIKKGYRLASSGGIIYDGNICVIQNFELVKK